MPSLSEETNGRIERLMPGATIGIIGGGQLGRMMALSARYMGFRIGVLDPTSDCPGRSGRGFPSDRRIRRHRRHPRTG